MATDGATISDTMTALPNGSRSPSLWPNRSPAARASAVPGHRRSSLAARNQELGAVTGRRTHRVLSGAG